MILLLDLETGGLDSAKSPILEIGAVWLDTDAEFFRCTRSTRRTLIEPDALRVNGLSPETNADTSRLLDIAAVCELVGWVKSRSGDAPRSVKLCGWNVHFDIRFLTDALTRAGIPIGTTPFSHQVLDLHSAVLMDQLRTTQAPPDTYGSSTLLRGSDHAATILGIPAESKPHNALNGANWAKTAALKLIRPIA